MQLSVKRTFPRWPAALGLATLGLAALAPSAAQAQTGTFQSSFAPSPVPTLTTTNPPTFSSTFTGTYAGGPNNIIGGSATIGITGAGTAPAVTTLITPTLGTPYNETTADLTNSTVTLAVAFNGNPSTPYNDTYTGPLHFVFDAIPNANTLALTGLLTDTSGQRYQFQLNESQINFGNSFRANATFAPIPEASTTVSLGLLLTLGMGGLIVAGKRRKASPAL